VTFKKGNLLKAKVFCEISNKLGAVEMFRDSALYKKSTVDIDIRVDISCLETFVNKRSMVCWSV